jgi:hypothetical protein
MLVRNERMASTVDIGRLGLSQQIFGGSLCGFFLSLAKTAALLGLGIGFWE